MWQTISSGILWDISSKLLLNYSKVYLYVQTDCTLIQNTNFDICNEKLNHHKNVNLIRVFPFRFGLHYLSCHFTLKMEEYKRVNFQRIIDFIQSISF